MFNKPMVILDRGKTKAKDFVYYDMQDAFIIFFMGLLGFMIGRVISELYQVTLFITLGGITAFLLFEMPNSLSILDYIKLGYHYYFKDPKIYAYIPNSIIEENKEEIHENEEERATIQHRKKKKKRIGKTKA